MGIAPKIIKDKVWAKIAKSPDVVLQVKHTQVAGEVEVVQVRDFIKSKGVDGHGCTFPIRLLPEVIEALTSLKEHLGVDHGRLDPGPEQGKLAV